MYFNKNKINWFIRLFALTICCFLTGNNIFAAQWQWSVQVNSIISSETNDHPRAFLWIPPNCKYVKAAIAGQHNMLEEPIFEDPSFRNNLAKLCIAEIWISPIFDVTYDFNRDTGEQFEAMLKSLADESGYAELANVPVIPIGHSALASYPWNFAAWKPSRTLAVISLHGDAPQTNLTGSGKPNPDWENRNIDGVPGLMIMGEYEWLETRLKPAAEFRQKHPNSAIAVLAEQGRGHFDYSDNLINYLNLFISKAVKYRLSNKKWKDETSFLNKIDPKKGWLVDIWQKDIGRKSKAAAYQKYEGDKSQAFWAFDREMALATENYNADQLKKSPQLLGFVQNGKLLEQNPKSHAQINLSLPILDENLSFKITGTFLENVPAGNPEKWSGLPQGSPIGHSVSNIPIKIKRICGPVVQTSPDTFAIRFYRMGLNSEKRTGDIWLIAEHPGDEKYKIALQQANLRIPIKNITGADQKITFADIPSQKSSVKSLKLQAASDANVRVFFYVREGNAEVVGDELRFTKIPPRAKFPLKVTIVAWQYGRYLEPKLKTAEPVEKTFLILK